MATVKTLTGMSTDTLIQVKVRAHNSDDWGDYSEINTAGSTIETTPSAMSTPSFDSTTTTINAIDLTWSQLSGTDKGGSSVTITGYVVYWDLGNGSPFAVLNTVSGASTTNYLKSGLTSGTTYSFKVLAVNKYGDGVLSSSVSIMTGQAPDIPSAPITSITSGSIYVDITWTYPTDNNFAVD
jgi:titin